MKKRISKFSILCTALATVGFRSGLPESRAETLHHLEYPNGYGCTCCPNVYEFGYFRTAWRQWPCEERPDKNFPRSIGMEVMPTPKGEKEVPLPKAPVAPPGQPPGLPPGPTYPGLPPGQEGGLPLPGPEGVVPSPGGYPPPGPLPEGKLPGEPKEPGKEPLPGLPSEETLGGDFKPIPGLPKELETPAPLEPELPKTPSEPEHPQAPSEPEVPQAPSENENKPESKSDKNAGGARNVNGDANAVRRGASVELRFVEAKKRDAPPPTPQSAGRERSAMTPDAPGQRGATPLRRLPNVPAAGAPEESRSSLKPQADWNAALQPDAYGERVRPTWYYAADDLARAAQYEEPVNASAQAERDPKIVPQSYQKRADAGLAPPMAPRQTSPSRSLAFEGYCPVELAQNGRWAAGHPQSSAVYRGQIYRFSGSKQRQQFLAAPEKYAPAFDGRDPVALAREKHPRPGRVDYCAKYRGRIYLFSSEAARKEFQRNPERYAVDL